MGEVRFLLHTNRYDATREMLTGLLGLPVTHEWDDTGRGTIVALGSEARLEILDAGGGRAGIVGVGVAIELDNPAAVESRHAELVAAGARPEPLVTTPWGHRSFSLALPGGVPLTFFALVG